MISMIINGTIPEIVKSLRCPSSIITMTEGIRKKTSEKDFRKRL